jgi:acetolactate synthase-1/2/3 large subunit
VSHLRSGGRVLVDGLLAHGLDTAFCVPGESYLPILDAFHDTPQMRLVVCRMEAGAANMAEAYGRVTGRPGVCLVTRGPGAAHAAVGVHTARQGSTPMLLLVGQVPREHRDREAFQEVDQAAFFRPLAKWAAEVDDPARLPEYLSRACHVATAGRPGPVVLALPEDVLREQVDVADAAPYRIVRPEPSRQALARVRDLLAACERPLAIVGGGGWSERTSADVQALCEAWGLPVGAAFRCQDYIDNRSPSYCGDIGLGIDARLAARVRDADVILALGARLDEPTTSGYTLIRAPRPRQALIHVHADPDELGRVFEPVLAINAGSAEFAAAALGLEPPDASRWAGWARAARADYEAMSVPGDVPGAVNLGQALAELRERLPEDTVLTNGAGNYTLWCHRFWRFSAFGTQVAPVSGAMGYGVPAAIAAKLARPDRTVLSVSGDGCFLMCAQELATAVRHDVKVIFIVVDNGMYGTIRMHQERHYPGRVSGTDLTNPDFAAYARAFGLEAETATSTAELVAAVERAARADVAALVHVPVSAEALTPRATLAQTREAALQAHR